MIRNCIVHICKVLSPCAPRGDQWLAADVRISYRTEGTVSHEDCGGVSNAAGIPLNGQTSFHILHKRLPFYHYAFLPCVFQVLHSQHILVHTQDKLVFLWHIEIYSQVFVTSKESTHIRKFDQGKIYKDIISKNTSSQSKIIGYLK